MFSGKVWNCPVSVSEGQRRSIRGQVPTHSWCLFGSGFCYLLKPKAWSLTCIINKIKSKLVCECRNLVLSLIRWNPTALILHHTSEYFTFKNTYLKYVGKTTQAPIQTQRRGSGSTHRNITDTISGRAFFFFFVQQTTTNIRMCWMIRATQFKYRARGW